MTTRLTELSISTTGNIVGNIVTANVVRTDNYQYANGQPFTGGSGTYGNANVDAHLAGTAGNIIPVGNNVQSLGNATNQWADLWVSNNTIYLNSVPISLGAGNVLTVNGEDVVVASNTGLVSVSSIDIGTTNFLVGDDDYLVFEGLVPGGIRPAETDTYNLGNVGKIWSEIHANVYYGNGSQLTGISTANTGNVTFSDQIVIGTGISNLVSGLYLAPSSSSANAVQYLRVRGDVTYEPTHIHFDTGNNQYFNQFIGDDNKYVLLSNTGNIVINTDDYAGNTAQWTFNTAGALTLPQGGIVYETNIPDGALSGSAIALKPTGGTNADQQLLVYPTVNDANHLHLTTGNLYNTELFLGNDNLYVKLANTGNVVINSNDDTGNSAQWTFGANGNLTLPGNILGSGNILIAPDSAATSSYLDIYLTGGPDIHIASNDSSIVIGRDTGANVFVGNDGEVSIQADAGTPYTWTFGNDGTTTFPAGNITSNTSLQFTTTFANVKTVEYQTAGVWDLYVEDVATGPNNAWSWIDVTFKDNLINKPQVFIENQKASDGIALRWTFDENGYLNFPRDVAGNTDPYLTIVSGANPTILSTDASLAGPANLGISALNTTFTGFTGDAIKIYPDDGEISSTANLQIWANSGGNTEYSWTFDNIGNLTLPQGGVVSEGAAPTGLGNTIAITPSGGSDADQQLLVYPTGNVIEGNHLHLTTGNLYNTELYLGNDNLYVKLANTGNVVINSYDGIGNAGQWTFGTDGNLTTPGAMIINGNINTLGSQTALLQSTDDLPLSFIASGANGTVTSFWAEDFGNLMASNIAAIYTPLQGTQTVRIVTGTNGGNIAIYDFDKNGVFSTAQVSATGNITGNYFVGNGSQLTGTVSWVTAPVANTSPGTAGQAAYDVGGNLYICVTANTWSKFTGTTSW